METVMTRIRAGMFVLAVVCLPVGRAQEDTVCEDVDGWKDRVGHDCHYYGPAMFGICRANGTMVEDLSTRPWWPDVAKAKGLDPSEAFPTTRYMEGNANAAGMSAVQACCFCGGGLTSNATESNTVPSAEDEACDDMNGWEDSDGHSCSYYVTMGVCKNGAHHPAHNPADFPRFANSEGVDALQACCGCGGGLASTMDTTQVAAAPSIHSNLAVILAGVVGLVCLA